MGKAGSTVLARCRARVGALLLQPRRGTGQPRPPERGCPPLATPMPHLVGVPFLALLEERLLQRAVLRPILQAELQRHGSMIEGSEVGRQASSEAWAAAAAARLQRPGRRSWLTGAWPTDYRTLYRPSSVRAAALEARAGGDHFAARRWVGAGSLHNLHSLSPPPQGCPGPPGASISSWPLPESSTPQAPFPRSHKPR